MDEKEFFYIDRPAVPATQQNLIDPDKLMDHAITVDSSGINPEVCWFASEVKNSKGQVVGTVLYAPYTTYEYVISDSSLVSDDGEVEEEDSEEADEEAMGHSDDAASYLDESDDVEVAHDIPPSDVDATLDRLDLELAEARLRVQQIEADILALESNGC